MPRPANVQPTMSTAGCRWVQAQTPATTTAVNSSAIPMRVMRVLPIRSPKRPCTSAAPAHASAAAVSAEPRPGRREAVARRSAGTARRSRHRTARRRSARASGRRWAGRAPPQRTRRQQRPSGDRDHDDGCRDRSSRPRPELAREAEPQRTGRHGHRAASRRTTRPVAGLVRVQRRWPCSRSATIANATSVRAATPEEHPPPVQVLRRPRRPGTARSARARPTPPRRRRTRGRGSAADRRARRRRTARRSAPPAPRPWIRRPTTRIGIVGASPAMTSPTMNSATAA